MRHRQVSVHLRRACAAAASAGTAGATLAPEAAPARAGTPSEVAAVQAERQRIMRWLHDSPLQALEYVAAEGWERPGAADPAELARIAADELRRFILEGGEPEVIHSLIDAVGEVVDEARPRGTHRIELVRGPTDGASRGPAVQALVGSLREALTNAHKHSGASRVLVYCEEEDGHALITVRDDDAGAGPSEMESGFGVRHSIIERMNAVGGWARVERAAAAAGLVVSLGTDGVECR